MSTEMLEKAFASTRGVLANVKPDQLDDPTPCTSWKVRDLVNHIVGGSQWFGKSVDAGESAPFSDQDWTAGDWMRSFDDGVKESVAAFGKPGAEEKIVKLPFGEFPGGIFMAIAANDAFTHGWDLAKATGQSTDLDPETATQLIGVAQMIPDDLRGPDGKAPFGPVVDCADSAPAADQLAAWMGRAP